MSCIPDNYYTKIYIIFQADICHAYQILHSHGIPDERIVVMMYDDIADNRENPVKDNIINRPDGPNVYQNVLKDYTKMEVNPETFINVLKGEKDKVNGKKVIDSGPKDHVFVNFVDHGGPGILGFGSKMLKAQKLMDAIMYMHDQKRYKKLVIYVEACESGSIFYDLLPKDINAYVTTASNAHESSYACYFDKTRKTYLGDVYSVKWMEDSDKEDLKSETLQKQFMITKSETNTSHVQEFGDMSIGDMTVAEFQGMQAAKGDKFRKAPPRPKDPCEDAVKSEDVPLEILRRSLNLVESKEEAQELEAKIQAINKERYIVNKTVKMIVGIATDDHVTSTNMMETRSHIQDWECYEQVLDFLDENCDDHLNIPENDYALRKLYMFVNMCEERIPVATITSAIEKVCLDATVLED
ncbi:legumain-like [Ruditapes philippinarum]|uniref:legumain-like n=1 Tax=Ruditapes philippinarum TaxID=129788 RepID=UPI00295C2094|nr:legumain-like [Ruditapes philippinarum]